MTDTINHLTVTTNGNKQAVSSIEMLRHVAATFPIGAKKTLVILEYGLRDEEDGVDLLVDAITSIDGVGKVVKHQDKRVTSTYRYEAFNKTVKMLRGATPTLKDCDDRDDFVTAWLAWRYVSEIAIDAAAKELGIDGSTRARR